VPCLHGSPCGSQKSRPGADGWQGATWLLERLYPTRFSKPEIQISLNNSFNQTVNALSITISPEEAREIEARAAPERVKVRRIVDEYQLRRGNGDQNANGSVSRKSLPITGRLRAKIRSSSGGVPFGCEVSTAKR
jgi:hypothetical protein